MSTIRFAASALEQFFVQMLRMVLTHPIRWPWFWTRPRLDPIATQIGFAALVALAGPVHGGLFRRASDHTQRFHVLVHRSTTDGLMPRSFASVW
jgi:hypothetical protein